MKVKDILKWVDAYTTIRIYENTSTVEDNWEIVYEGAAFDMSWHYADKELILPEFNGGSEAICPYITERGEAGLRITLAEENF